MAQFQYDSTYDPAAPVIEIGVGIPAVKHPLRHLRALVDSGADATVLPRSLLDEIGARFVGHQIMSGVTGEKETARLYLVLIHMPTGISYGIRAVARERLGEALIGRDVLNQWRITLDGPGETVEIDSRD